MFRITSVGFGKSDQFSGVYHKNKFIPAKRGMNLYVIDNDDSITSQNYDTFEFNYAMLIADYIKFHLNPDTKYIICVVHDEASTNLNVNLLKTFLPGIRLDKISNLAYRSSYYFVFEPQTNLLTEGIDDASAINVHYNNGEVIQAKRYYIVCLHNIFCYFVEYIDSIRKHFNASYLLLSDLINYPYSEDPNVVYMFCQWIEPALMSKPFNKIVVNTEQMTDPHKYAVIKAHLDNKIMVIDYSLENIGVMKHYLGDSIDNVLHFLPYQYRDEEINLLRDCYKNTKKIYDIAFCGHPSDRRKVVLDTLRGLGFKILQISAWDKHRDLMIASCKILINIHVYDMCNVYESLRCDRWAFAYMPIVSEDSVLYNELDVKRHNLISFCKYSDLVDTVKEFMNDIKYPNEDAIEAVRAERLVHLQKVEEAGFK